MHASLALCLIQLKARGIEFRSRRSWRMPQSEGVTNNLSGLAALSICESLLLALCDRSVLSDYEINGLLQDAADAHRNAQGTSQELEKHRAVAAIIERLRAGRHLARNSPAANARSEN